MDQVKQEPIEDVINATVIEEPLQQMVVDEVEPVHDQPVDTMQPSAAQHTQGGGDNTREHRIGLLSQRIKDLEDQHVFTKERKQELSNLRKKLRIDKNNQARFLRQQTIKQPVDQQQDSQMQQPESEESKQESDAPVEQHNQQSEDMEPELNVDNSDSVKQYSEFIRQQLKDEEEAIEKQKQFQQKQLEEIRSNILQMQSKWDTQKDKPILKEDLTGLYAQVRMNKNRRTLIGEALYKMNKYS